MGKEVVYCFRCGKRLLEEVFSEGKAVSLPRGSACRSCLEEIRSQLSAEELQILDRPHAVPEPKTSAPAPSKPPTIRRHSTLRAVVPLKSGSPVLLVIGGVVAVGALILVLIPSRPTRRPAPESPPPAAIVETPPPRETPVEAPTPRRDPFEEARSYAKSHPEDLTGIARKIRAVPVPPDDELRRYLDALDRAMSDREKKIDALRRQHRDLLTVLQLERSSFDDDEWRRRIDRRLEALKRAILDELAAIEPRAIDKAKEGKLSEAMALLDPIDLSIVGVEVGDLKLRLQREAEAAARPKAEATADQKAAFEKASREAIDAASRREYDLAKSHLETLRDLETTALSDRLALLIAAVRKAGEFYAALREGAAAGVPFPAEILWHEPASNRSVKGTVVFCDRTLLHLREPNMIRDARVVPWSIVDTDSLLLLGRSLLAGRPSLYAELAAFLCLEGKLDQAKKEYPQAGPWLDSLSSVRKNYPPAKTTRLSETPEYKAREKEALKLFQEAEKLYGKEPIRAIEKLMELQKTYAESEVVETKKDKIKKMLEYGREYAWTPSTLKKFTDGWKPATSAKDPRAFVYFEKNVDAAKIKKVWLDTDWIELEINALPNTRYWIHVYVGCCCQQASQFTFQGDDLSVILFRDGKEEKGAVNIGTGSGFTFRGFAQAGTHTEHAAPTTWGWLSLNPVEFSNPGVKKIRLYPACKGSSLSHVAISAGKYKGAAPTTLKELGD